MAVSTDTVRADRLDLPSGTVSTGLIAYGVVGLLLAAVLLLALGPADLGGLGRIDTERQAVIELLSATEATAADSRIAVQQAQASVNSGADAAAESAAFATELGGALRQLGSALRVDVLGARPFDAAAADVDRAADRADATAAGLEQAAGQARAGADGMGTLATDLDRAAAELAEVRAGLEGVAGLGASLTWLRIALIGLVLWLAVPAVACIWIGLRLRRSTSPHAHR